MSEEIELKLLRENEELRQRLNRLEGKNENGIPSYNYSTIKLEELTTLVDIERDYIKEDVFNHWFDFEYDVNESEEKFLQTLIDKNIHIITLYHEEDLKVNFIVPLINKIDFFMLKDKIRNFYHETLFYQTDKFIFNGKADFIVSKGIRTATNPYFFIQEFKKGVRPTDPEPQLLAELISAIELNNELSIRGAYIVGENWNFVILEKLGKDRYQYFVSRTFNCTNIEDLKGIYKNLMFVKNEIIEMVKKEKI